MGVQIKDQGGADTVGVQNGTRALFANDGRFLVKKKMTVK
jgi:hypothetical protein